MREKETDIKTEREREYHGENDAGVAHVGSYSTLCVHSPFDSHWQGRSAAHLHTHTHTHTHAHNSVTQGALISATPNGDTVRCFLPSHVDCARTFLLEKDKKKRQKKTHNFCLHSPFDAKQM